MDFALRKDWKQKRIASAKNDFKDFEAEFTDFGAIQTLDWRNKNGSSNYYVRYIFDTKQRHMYISGDLGSACFNLTWEPTFENMQHYVQKLDYITGKLVCATDLYVYPQAIVRAEIEDWYADSKPKRDDYEEEEEFDDALEHFEEVMEAFIFAHDYHNGLRLEELEYIDELADIDPDWQSNNFGRCLAPRVYLWFVGLEMAWEKEKEKMMFPSKEIVEKIREEYPAGTRIELTKMDDVQAPPIGTKGTVRGVDDTGSILVSWDNGSSLNVIYGADECRKVAEREEEYEYEV